MNCLFVYNIDFGLDAFICIMAYFITIEVNNEIQVFAELTGIGSININS